MATPRKSAVRFRERSELLDFLLEVSAATSETLDLDRLLANVGDIVKKVVDCELFAILLYNERSQDLRIRFAVGHRPEIVDNLTVTLKDGLPEPRRRCVSRCWLAMFATTHVISAPSTPSAPNWLCP